MVSSKALFGLITVAGIIHAFPLRPIWDRTHSQSHDLTPRSPNPRFKNPFDVADFLKGVDQKIPDNSDIQHWVKEAQDKGAMAANGDLNGEDDDDDKSDDDKKKKEKEKEKEKKKKEKEKEEKEKKEKDKTKQLTHSQSQPLPQPTDITNALANLTLDNSPDPQENAETQATTVYVPVPVFSTPFPLFDDDDETSSSTPIIFPPPSATPTAEAPAETPVSLEDLNWK